MSEQNKALVRRFFEDAWNTGNLALIDVIMAPDVVVHGAPPGARPGSQGIKHAVTMFRTAFPDIHMTIEDMLAEGDKVAIRLTATGTHKGELMGIAPTGKHVSITATAIYRFAGGKIQEGWVNRDDLGMMQQLGVVPPPGQG